MVSPRKYEKGIRSLLGSAEKAFDKAVKDSSRRPGLIEALRMNVLDDYSVNGRPSMPVVAQPAQPAGPGLIQSMRMGVLDDYSIYGRPSMPVVAQPAAPLTALGPVARPDPSQVIPPEYPPMIARPAAAVVPEILPPISRGGPPLRVPGSNLPADVTFSGAIADTLPEAPAFVQSFLNDPRLQPKIADVPGFIRKKIEDAPRVKAPIPAAIEEYKKLISPNVEYIDGKPYIRDENGTPRPYKSVLTEGPSWDWLFGEDEAAPPASPTATPGTPTPAQPKPGRLSDEYIDPATVLPPDNTDVPVVVPAAGTEDDLPELDATGLPGTSTETATGALSLDDYLKKMKDLYPDLDFTNPKQAEADANARRDLDRTAMLAQLQLAAGIVGGAGPGWEGIGQGFGNAAGAYDKGFQRYQQTLQDSADRYGKQMESQMTYDTARRQAALGLYTAAEERTAASKTEWWKAQRERELEVWKGRREDKRAAATITGQNIRDFFTKKLKLLEPPSDPSTISPEELAERARQYDATMRAMQRSLLAGEVVQPEDTLVDVTGG